MYFLLVIVDSDPAGNTCHSANFNIGGTTTTSRSWTIRVTQYACGDTDMSGYEFTIYQFTYSRVDMVMTIHNNLLKTIYQWVNFAPISF